MVMFLLLCFMVSLSALYALPTLGIMGFIASRRIASLLFCLVLSPVCIVRKPCCL